MIIKLCGIKTESVLNNASNLALDLLGLNFYEPSVRYFGAQSIECTLETSKKLVGVFVNATYEDIMLKVKQFALEYVQLHGNESLELCNKLATKVKVIKAIGVKNMSDIMDVENQYSMCSYILFDTKTPLFGGSGQAFDWHWLEKYAGNTPFLLAGGIGPRDFDNLKNIGHKKFAGIDINSKFEDKLGDKDLEIVAHFIQNIKH